MMVLVRYQLVFVCFVLSFIKANCQDSDYGLSDFTKKVKSLLPPDTLKKVFSVQRDNPDQFPQAIRNGIKKLEELYKTPLPSSIAKRLIQNGEDYKHKAATKLFFRVLVNAVGDTLKDQGVLNSNNLDVLAKSLTTNYENAAKSLKSENVQETYPAIIAANVELLKSLGQTSPTVQIKLANNIDQEVQILTKETAK